MPNGAEDRDGPDGAGTAGAGQGSAQEEGGTVMQRKKEGKRGMNNEWNAGRTAGIDLNCDMGEGYGIYRCGDDAELLRHVTSANIACGFHAGDPTVMKRTVRLCLERNVALGAHPGLPDLQGFGRRRMAIPAEEIHDLVLYQIGALHAIAAAEGGRLVHVKPHGALYHMAGEDEAVAAAVAEAVERAADAAGHPLMLVALPAGKLAQAGARRGIAVLREAFADRRYAADGSLAPRSAPGSVLTAEEAAGQALSIARDGTALAAGGSRIRIAADTICLHGDTPGAAATAAAIRQRLQAAGIAVRSVRAR